MKLASFWLRFMPESKICFSVPTFATILADSTSRLFPRKLHSDSAGHAEHLPHMETVFVSHNGNIYQRLCVGGRISHSNGMEIVHLRLHFTYIPLSLFKSTSNEQLESVAPTHGFFYKLLRITHVVLA